MTNLERLLADWSQGYPVTAAESERLMQAAGLGWMLGLPDSIILDEHGEPVTPQPTRTEEP